MTKFTLPIQGDTHFALFNIWGSLKKTTVERLILLVSNRLTQKIHETPLMLQTWQNPSWSFCGFRDPANYSRDEPHSAKGDFKVKSCHETQPFLPIVIF